jgi:hypothetical protein
MITTEAIIELPNPELDAAVHLMADQVIAWGGALKALRAH